MEKILYVVIKLLSYFIRKANSLKYYINKKHTELKWKYFFEGKNIICYELDNNCKINLKKNNKLTEYIIFQHFEEKELKFFEIFLKKNDIVIDIGANIGLHSIYCSKILGKEGKVFSFEPTPETFIQLTENIELNKFNNVKTYNLGLSNSETTLKINTSNNYDAWNTFTDVKKHINQGIFDNTFDVDVIRLDKWIEDEKIEIQKITLIKIDVEGWEKFVIEGSSKLLSQPNPPAILIEFDEDNAWAAGYLCHELYDLIKSFGYNFFSFDIETNCLKKEPKKLHYPSQNLIALKHIARYSDRIKFLVE